MTINPIFTSNPFKNPELHRNLWIEFSWFKALAIPALLLIFIYLIARGERDIAETANTISLTAAFFFFYIGAVSSASNAFRDELKDRTWDFQLMSSLNAWSLGFGKFFGAVSYYWFCTAICMAIYLISLQFLSENDANDRLSVMFSGPILFILCGYLGQLCAYIMALQTLPNNKARQSSTLFSSAIAFVIASAFAFGSLTISAAAPLQYLAASSGQAFTLNWFGFEIHSAWFFLYSLFFFLFWAHVAVYRSMRIELQYKTIPWVWIVFLLTMLIYSTGCVDIILHGRALMDEQIRFARTLFACVTMIGATYIGGYSYSNNFIGYSRFSNALKRRDYIAAFRSTPPWIISGTAAIILLIALIVWQGSIMTNDGAQLFAAPLLALTLFAARDIIIFHTIFIPGLTRYNGFVLIVYLLCAYVFSALILENTAPAFYRPIIDLAPPYKSGGYADAIPAAIQVLLATGLLQFCLRLAKNKLTMDGMKEKMQEI